MSLTRAADYAVRVMIHLANLPPGTRVSREVLARAGDVPSYFLGKILQSLTRSGMIASHRGVTGGFSLLSRPDELNIVDIITAIEGPIWLNSCVDPQQPCARQNWCGAHQLWMEAQAAMLKVLRGKTIADLAKESAENLAATAADRCRLVGGTEWS